MKNIELINCYCFNKNCKRSIFNHDNYCSVKLPLTQILSEAVYCEECHEELIAKPVLEIKLELTRALEEKVPVA